MSGIQQDVTETEIVIVIDEIAGLVPDLALDLGLLVVLIEDLLCICQDPRENTMVSSLTGLSILTG